MFKQVWDAEDLTVGYHRNVEGTLGKIRHSENGKVYRWVENKTAETLSAGQVVYHGTNDLTFGEIYKLNQSAKGTAHALMAGVVMAALETNGNFPKKYGWVQCNGGHDAIFMLSTTTPIAVGSFCIGVNDQFYATHGVAAGTAPTYVRGIVGLEALASTVTVATTRKGSISCYS